MLLLLVGTFIWHALRDAAMVEPGVIAEDPELHAMFLEASDQALASYTKLLEGLEKKFADVENVTARRKQARQAARAVLARRRERSPNSRASSSVRRVASVITRSRTCLFSG